MKNMTLGEKIQALRAAHRLSQEALAERLGVSRQAVSKWETGLAVPSTDKLIALSRLFDVPIEELTRPELRVQMVPEFKAEIGGLRRRSKGLIWLCVAFLLLFVTTFAAALYARFHDTAEQTVLALVLCSCAFLLCAFLPILVTIMRMVYSDCKQRSIAPGFWVVISMSVAGLLYYLLSRESLTRKDP